MFFGNMRIFSVTAYYDLTRKEIFLFSFLIVALFLRGLRPSLFLNSFLVDTLNILEHAKLGLFILIFFLVKFVKCKKQFLFIR